MNPSQSAPSVEVPRQSIAVDIVCVGFGPAMGGFLTTLTRHLPLPDGTTPQILCYERADDIAFGVSGVVTRGRAIRESFPNLDLTQIPLTAPVKQEKVVYLLDPVGASRRTPLLRMADKLLRACGCRHDAFELPYIPPFLRKHDGFVTSISQFMQWVGQQVLSSGSVQVWPGTPAAEPLIESDRVVGVRLVDQENLPGMDVRAALTVVGDGPVGAIGHQIDQRLGVPQGHQAHDWAVGMKFVVNLPENSALEPGTVLHTLGYPEPEIFGFLYVYPERVASLGIFVPSWFNSPVRTAYRYLQHWMLHPYLWRYLNGGSLRSWGAKTLAESGRRAEPFLVGNGYARIGEGSGSTNVLTGSGVDEAWATGVMLGEAVVELLKQKKPFTKENLEATYVARRRASWLEQEARVAESARDGFHKGLVTGLLGMALVGATKGRLRLPVRPRPPSAHTPSLAAYYEGRIPLAEVEKIRQACAAKGTSAHPALMERAGWPAIPYDGKLLVSHQDALLMGGKVQAPPGYAPHVLFLYPELCRRCDTRICVEVCSGQAITPGETGVPVFDREKCVHCGACWWNCPVMQPDHPARPVLEFRAAPGGLHSAEN